MLSGLVCSPGISAEAQPELRTQVRSSAPYKRRWTHPQGLEREMKLSRVVPACIGGWRLGLGASI